MTKREMMSIENENKLHFQKMNKEVEIIGEVKQHITRYAEIRYKGTIYNLTLSFNRYFKFIDLVITDELGEEISCKENLYDDIYDWVMFSSLTEDKEF